MSARTTSRACHPTTPAAILAAALLAVGCSGEAARTAEPGASGGPGLAPPGVLLQARAVDRARLEPRVSIVDGPEIPMVRDGERWRGTVDVAPERDYVLDILWVEIVVSGERARELPLATLRLPVAVGADGALRVVDATEYDVALDFDGDGVTNLAEREANSDPFGDGFVIDDPLPSGPGVPVPPIEPAPDDAPTAPGAGDPDVLVPIDQNPDVPGPPAPEPDSPVEPLPVEPVPVEPLPVEPPAPVEPTRPDPIEADVVIPRVAPGAAPVIDGRGVVNGVAGVWGGEWANATSFDSSGGRLFVDRLMIDKGTDETNGQAFRAWSAMHDGEYLYVLVVVEDDGKRVRDEDADSTEIWQDDSLEVYVDGDNSKNTSYGDGDDSGRILPLLAPGTTRQGTSEGIVKNFLSADTPIRIDFATGPGIGPDGLRRPRFEQDVYELRIDLDSAAIVPGRVFGFELQVNDDDDGGDREAKWGWAHPARIDVDVDETFRNPSFMGTAILE